MKTDLRVSGSLLSRRRIEEALNSDSVRSALKRSGEIVRDEAEALLDSQTITGRARGRSIRELAVEIDPDAAKARLVRSPASVATDNPGLDRSSAQWLASALMVARDEVRVLLRDGVIRALKTGKTRS
ncbi:MAG: hypothetical protein V6Z86_08505 [Hyphomicrobiales bacterium]